MSYCCILYKLCRTRHITVLDMLHYCVGWMLSCAGYVLLILCWTCSTYNCAGHVALLYGIHVHPKPCGMCLIIVWDTSQVVWVMSYHHLLCDTYRPYYIPCRTHPKLCGTCCTYILCGVWSNLLLCVVCVKPTYHIIATVVWNMLHYSVPSCAGQVLLPCVYVTVWHVLLLCVTFCACCCEWHTLLVCLLLCATCLTSAHATS